MASGFRAGDGQKNPSAGELTGEAEVRPGGCASHPREGPWDMHLLLGPEQAGAAAPSSLLSPDHQTQGLP